MDFVTCGLIHFRSQHEEPPRVAFTGVVDVEVQFVSLAICEAPLHLIFRACIRELGGSVVDTVLECTHLFVDDKVRVLCDGWFSCSGHNRLNALPSFFRLSAFTNTLLAESGSPSVAGSGSSSVSVEVFFLPSSRLRCK
jgi:hypothetical protein